VTFALGLGSIVWLTHFQPRAVEQSAVAHFERIGADFRNDEREPDWLDKTLGEDPPPRVREIWLNKVTLKPGDLAPLRDLPWLDVLSLERSTFEARELTHLQNLRNLRFLYLGNTELGSEGVRQLPRLPSIEYVSLERIGVYDTRVSDDGFHKLLTSKTIRTIGIGRTLVSRSARMDALKTHPEWSIQTTLLSGPQRPRKPKDPEPPPLQLPPPPPITTTTAPSTQPKEVFYR